MHHAYYIKPTPQCNVWKNIFSDIVTKKWLPWYYVVCYTGKRLGSTKSEEDAKTCEVLNEYLSLARICVLNYSWAMSISRNYVPTSRNGTKIFVQIIHKLTKNWAQYSALSGAHCINSLAHTTSYVASGNLTNFTSPITIFSWKEKCENKIIVFDLLYIRMKILGKKMIFGYKINHPMYL